MKEYKLSELADIIGGGTPKTSRSDYWGGDIPWLSVVDFNNDFRHVFTTEKTITEAGLNNSSTRILYPGEIIISARGTVGALAQVAKEMAFNQSCYGLRAKPGITCNDYLFYLLRHSIETIKKNTHGSVFDTITRDTFESISVILPDLKTQQKVASILTAFDDKIELNAQINHNLEEQAKAIFKSWFVDFEPFQNGKFVDSELGKIPEGWRVGTLNEIADITMGQSPQGASYNENAVGTVFYQGRAEFTDRFPSRRLFTTEPKRMANAGDVLLSVRAPVGDLNIANEPCCIGRGLAAIHAKNGFASFIFYTMQALKTELEKYNGEGTVFGCINKDSLSSQKVIIPPRNIIADFESIASSLDCQYFVDFNENIHLAQLRDTLLPKLMSGEIDVSEVEI